MGRLVHTGLGSSSLVAHVLHYPPPPPHANSFVTGNAEINTHTAVPIVAHVLHYPPPTHANSFVTGTAVSAVINTHTAVPIIKLFAKGEGDSGGHVL
jgi:hypothetical protein